MQYMLLTFIFEYDADMDLHVTFVNPSKDIDLLFTFLPSLGLVCA